MRRNHLLFAFIAIVLAGCDKDKITPSVKDPNPPVMKKLFTVVNIQNPPTVSNGRLTFGSVAQFENYLTFLDSSMNVNDTFDQNEVLENIEQGYGYISLRHNTHAAWEQQASIGFTDLSQVPEEHFVKSLIARSIFNYNMEVAIGSKISKIINDTYGILIDANQPNLLSQVYQLGSNPSIYDIMALDPLQSHMQIINWKHNITETGPVQRPTGSFTLGEPGVDYPDQCYNPKYVRFTRMNLFDLGTFSMNKGYYEINYGDGSPLEYKTSSLGTNEAYVADFYHTYPAFGTYSMHIRVRAISPSYSGSTYIAEATMSVVISSLTSCGGDVRGTATSYAYFLGNTYALGKRTWTDKWVNLLGVTKRSFNSKTIAYRKESDNKWHNYKGKSLVAQVEGYKYSRLSSGCTTDGYVNKSETGDGKQKEVEYKADYFKWQTISSMHRLKVGPDYYYGYNTLNICP